MQYNFFHLHVIKFINAGSVEYYLLVLSDDIVLRKQILSWSVTESDSGQRVKYILS